MSLQSNRIKSEMERHSFTLQDVEQRTGIKKSSMQRYASGETGKIPISAIEKLAKMFGVTAAYLMGWDDEEEKSVSPDKLALTEGEQMVLDLFRRVPEEQQKIVLEMIRAALGTRG